MGLLKNLLPKMNPLFTNDLETFRGLIFKQSLKMKSMNLSQF